MLAINAMKEHWDCAQCAVACCHPYCASMSTYQAVHKPRIPFNRSDSLPYTHRKCHKQVQYTDTGAMPVQCIHLRHGTCTGCVPLLM
jgi:hypothetical protein